MNDGMSKGMSGATSSGLVEDAFVEDAPSAEVENIRGRLIRTPRPHPRESLFGYALRLAEANGYPTPGYFMSPGRVQLQVSKNTGVDAIRLAAGLDDAQIDRLRSSSVEDGTRYGRLLGQRVSIYDLDLIHPKICPDCIAENGHVEALWDLAWIAACPGHGRELIDRCPHCSSILTWSRPELLKCRHGHDLRDAGRIEASEASVQIATMMSRKLYAGLPEFPGLDSPHLDRTDGLSLYEVCRIAGKLANHLAKQLRKSERNHRGRVALAARDDVTNAIADLMCRDERSCIALFDALCVDPNDGKRHRSYHQAFQWLLELFPKDRAAETMPSLLALVFAYASEHWPSCRLQRTSSHFADFVGASQWMSISEAGHEIGVGDKKMRESIARGEVPAQRVSEKSNHNLIVPTEWVKEQKAVQKVVVDKVTLRNNYGLTHAILSALRDKGLYLPSLKAKAWEYFESDMVKFESKLLVGDIEEFIICGPEQITLDGVMHLRASDAARAEFVASAIRGEIVPIGRIKHVGLPGLMFERDRALRQLLKGEIEVTVQEASFFLDCHNAMGLVAATYLKTSRLSRGKTYVSMKSVIEFDKKFLSARCVLEDAGIPIPTLLRIARLAKIELMSVPNVYRDGKIWFIPRDCIQELREAVPIYRNVYPPHKR